MTNKKIIFCISFIFLCSTLGYCNTRTLIKNYEKFSKYFKERKFKSASKYISSKDMEVFEELTKINAGYSEEFTVEKELEKMWALNYDKEIKNIKIQEVIESGNSDTNQMSETLKETGITDNEVQ